MQRRSRLAAAAAILLVGAVSLTACSSSGSSGSSGSSSSAQAGSAPSGKSIVIGLICSCTGPFASTDGGLPQVADAWTKSVNAAGGLNGHPVEVKVADDAGDATKSQQMVRKLVESDHVVAIVDEVASYDASWADYVAGKGVPVLAGVSFTVPMSNNADFFPTGSNLAAVTYGLLKNAETAGTKKLAVLACAEAPLCAGYAGEITRIAKAIDSPVKLVYSSKISATQASYTAQCLAAKAAGADALYVGHGGTIVTRVVQQCVQQGYKPTELQVGGDVINDWGKDPNMDGVVIAQLHLPLHDTSTAGGKAFQAAITKYAPSYPTSSNYSGEAMSTWTGFQLFAAAAKAAALTPTSTTADVKKGLYALKDETLDGLTPPLNYTEGKPTTIDCYFNEGISGGKWTTPGGSAPVCLPTDVATKVNAAFNG